jgi:DNA-binding FrmR family transcriptional regulator
MSHVQRDREKLIRRVRRIRGQVGGVERALAAENSDCGEVLRLIASARGAMNSLMAEVMEGHIHDHVLEAQADPSPALRKASAELIDVVRAYLK